MSTRRAAPVRPKIILTTSRTAIAGSASEPAADLSLRLAAGEDLVAPFSASATAASLDLSFLDLSVEFAQNFRSVLLLELADCVRPVYWLDGAGHS